MLETPVVLFIFRRPELTRRVLEVLRLVQPRHLLVVSDGPRASGPSEAELCQAARGVIEEVDWPCQVYRNDAAVNLGCGRRVATGIAWTFEQFEEAIFLEDDCLPDPSFFEMARQLLEVYRDDPRVMTLSGFNPLGSWRSEQQSYCFSRYGSHWCWATWKRAWLHYDYDMQELDKPGSLVRLQDEVADPEMLVSMRAVWDRIRQGNLDTWDSQWRLAQLLQGSWSVVPAVNLVSNIGFGRQATHTRQTLGLSANQERQSLSFPLKAPPHVAVDQAYDRRYMNFWLGRPDAELVLARVEQHLGAHRNAQALLLAEAALRNQRMGLTETDRNRLESCRERAVAAMRARNLSERS